MIFILILIALVVHNIAPDVMSLELWHTHPRLSFLRLVSLRHIIGINAVLL